jgi:phosphatidylglycerophosphate synthase
LCLAILQEYRGGIALALWAGLALFLSGITDLFDGMLARKWNVVSTLGKMADPLMDKIFYVITFPALVWMIVHQGESESHALLMLGFSILYLARDLWVTFMRSIGTMYGADVAETVTIQYGGSMNEKNASELLAKPNVDGGLIGGASLVPEKFTAIVDAAQ